MGCKTSKQTGSQEFTLLSEETPRPAVSSAAAADPGRALDDGEAVAATTTSDSTSTASQHGSSAHPSQAASQNTAQAVTEGQQEASSDLVPAAQGQAPPANGLAGPCPFDTPDPATPGSAPHLSHEYRYNSIDRPPRSSMRVSLDGSRRTSTAEGRRRSVGFSVEEVEEKTPSLHSEGSGFSTTSTLASSDSVSLKKIVDMFYDRVLVHPHLKGFFDGIDMIKLKKHQVKFMALAFGGRELVNEEDPSLDLRKIHYRLIKHMGLGLDHWETFVGLFEDVLRDLPSIPAPTKGQAMASIRATKPFFVPISQEAQVPKSLMDAPEVPVNEAMEGLAL